MKSLEGTIALVAGATRGAGRGIAVALGEAGATVYCTGRSTRGKPITKKRKVSSVFQTEGRPETIDETAEMVNAHGGKGIAVQTDHTDEQQVKKLFARIKREQGGLDILVNDIWGGDSLTEWGKPFWKLDLNKGFAMMQRAIFSHIITSRYGVPLMLGRPGGLLVEITDGNQAYYRGTLFYDFVKMSVIRLAFAMAHELKGKRITALAVTPGFLRSETMLEHFGVTEQNWREGAKKDPNFIASESPMFVGRAIAALAADRNVFSKSGKVFSSWQLSDEYGFTDADGQRPHWGRYIHSSKNKALIAFQKEFSASHHAYLQAFSESV
ncbi:MAG: SDR family oxidoreductase [Ignavibacteriales bacterium]|nr:SDR family oxidoreductase [Ignavibacteriales bacterium]